MNRTCSSFMAGASCMVLLQFSSGAESDQISLQLNSTDAQAEVRVHSEFQLPVSSMYPEFVIQGSTDMVTWSNIAGPISGSVGVSDELLRVPVPTLGDRAFYRVVGEVKLDTDTAQLGEAVFGYSTEFSKQLQSLGQLSLPEFVQLYSLTNEYLPQITFDPTTAEFWNEFNIDPAVYNATSSWPNYRYSDFRLSPEELSVFQTNGFVVSQRMERESFADIYYEIYTEDLPVFITTDSILHAWHRSFVTMLEEIEETRLKDQLSALLTATAARVPALWTESTGTALPNGVMDADYFLAVARSLINGGPNYGYLGQNSRVAATLTAINQQQMVLDFNLYGERRDVDFSQLIVRGHYANSPTLSNYFRAMMWCAQADFRYAGFSSGIDRPGQTNTLRELSGAVALHFLVQNSGQFTNWFQLNRTLEMYVGTPDSLNLSQLNDLLNAADILAPADLPDPLSLTNLQNALMSGELGMQQVTGFYRSPLGPGRTKLPRSFTFMGQRFVPDSWALSKCTFDDILWDDWDATRTFYGKVLRRVPSALDVAFAVLGNDQTVPDIAARIALTNLTYQDGRIFWRDGMFYQHNLAAVRNTIDAHVPSAWTNSIYMHWLDCLRELSPPTTSPEYPEAMRTRAWAMKTLNTQLASWTQLRHNTILYAQQSYTPIVLCSYPDGYVEPRPAFYRRLKEMALATSNVLAMLPTNGVFYFYHTNAQGQDIEVEVTGATMHSNRLAVMDSFARTSSVLESISEKELGQLPLSEEEANFLQHVVEVDYTGDRTYTGWFPSLFYEPAKEYLPLDPTGQFRETGDDKGSDYWDALVTDVHTDGFDLINGDPGSILHEGVGNVQLIMIAVDCGHDDLAVYAGPVLSHYEFEEDLNTRLTDAEWKERVVTNGLPPAPDWTSSYLVPRP